MNELWRPRLCRRRIGALLGLCALLLVPRGARAQYTTCNFSPANVTSTEAWTAANGMVLCGGTYNVQSFSIPSGYTVYVVAGGAVTINATDWIEITGILNADYTGGAGGAGCVSGTSGSGGVGAGSGGGRGGFSEYYGGYGGGGGAYGCSGSACGGSGGYPVYDTGTTAGGSPYDSNTSVALQFGSGGGGGGCAVLTYPEGGEPGGAGGGAIALIAPQVQVDAASEIFAYGGNGAGGSTGGGGGGGSGGDITISANTVLSVSGSAYVQALGGNGGAGGYALEGTAQYIGGGGGGGSGGRIKYFGPAACTPVGNASGGSGGAGATLSGKSSAAGTAGQYGDVTCTAVTSLTVSASLSPSPTAPNASTTITAVASNPSGYLLLYQYDCTGSGTSYSAATSASSATCSWATTGMHTVDVKVLGYNAAPLIDGTAAGGYLVTSTTTTTSVVVGLNPTITLTVPATGNIGQSISLQGSVTDINGATSYTYAWTYGDGTGSNATTASTTNTVSHTYEMPSTETITLTVTDSLGFVGSATTTIAIAEVDPTLTIGTIPAPIHSGTAATFSATASSPSTTATQAGFFYDFAWGDGSSDSTVAATASNTNVSAAHDYTTPGTYMLTVTVTDEFGGMASEIVMVTVLDPSPIVSLNAPSYSVALDSSLTVTGAASSAYAPAEAAGFTFVFNWGDGTSSMTSSGAASPQALTHSYDAPGTFTLQLTVTDDAGVASSTTATVTVTKVAPVVTIGPLPVPAYSGAAASFSASATSVSTSATSAGFSYVFAWGDGTANTTVAASSGNGGGVSTTHTYATAGPFTLTVTATDKYSEAGTNSASLTVFTKAPAVTLTLSATSVPIETAVTATATASASYAPDGASGFTFVYSWGDGTANTTVSGTSPQAPTHTYDAAGTFTVSISVTDAAGVAGTATRPITVTDIAPAVTIGALPVPAYAGFAATYAASATSPSATYTTDGFTYVFAWGDGTTSTTIAAASGNGSGVSTPHTYASAGPYTLTVTVTDHAGTTASITAAVTIYSKAPTVTLGLSATSVPIETSVTATATAAASYTSDGAGGFTFVYNWGDGTANTTVSGPSPQAPTHTYDAAGTFTVSVSVTDATGVAGTATKSITVTDIAPMVTIGTLPVPAYSGFAATYTASATSPSTTYTTDGFTYVFAWGDGTTSTTIAAAAGNGSGVSTTHTYATAGPYTLTVTATDHAGTTASTTAAVTIYSKAPGVTLNLSATSVPIETAVTGTATASASYVSDGASGFTFVYNWGDGTANTTITGTSPQAPTHAYDAAGMFTISVSVTDATGVTGTATKSITVTDIAPTVTIGALPAPVYAGITETYSASATSPSATYTTDGFTYVFGWGDGTANTTISATAGNGSGVSTTHSYVTGGPYTLTVTVTDKAGTSGSSTTTVTLYSKAPAVTLTLAPTSVPIESAVTATATAIASYAPDGAGGFTFIYSWGDGTANTTVTGTSPQAPTHAYDSAGMFTVTVSATDATGVAGTATKSITVTDLAPTVTIGALPLPVYAGVSGSYSASATSPSTTYTAAGFTYVFAWGDGTASTTIAATAGNASGVTTTHSYAIGGPYTLTVTVTDKAGTSASSTATVSLYSKAPAVTLALSSASIAIEALLTATATASASYPPDDANGFTFVYSWGDGTPSTTVSGTSPQAPTHAYDTVGTFSVSVSVTDATGVATVATKPITVTDIAPTVTIGTLPVPTYAGSSATWTASATSPSTTYTTDGFTYLFAWGDGTTSTTIAASSSNGSGVSTTHTYAAAGPYTLTVTATDAAGTSKSATAAVTIYTKAPAIGLSLSATTIPIETAVTATATATASYSPDGASGFTFVYGWGDGTVNTTVSGTSPQAPTHAYDVPGAYTVTLTVTDATGVASTTSKPLTVTDTAPTLTIGALPTPVHSGDAATFSASATSPSSAGTLAGFTYVFAWGDGTASTTITPTASNGSVSAPHTFATTGTFTLTVSVTDLYGGTASKTASVVVYSPKPVVTLQATPTTVAIGATLQATVTATSPYAGDSTGGFTAVITWGDGTSTMVNGASPLLASHVYGAPGAQTIQVSVTDATGVAGTASAPITVTEVVPTVTLGAVPSPIYAVTTTVTFTASATSPSAAATLAGFTYVFAWGDGTPNTTIAAVPANGAVSTAHVFPTPGTFTVRVTATDEFNGSSSASAPVTALDPIPTVAFGASMYMGSAASAVSFTTNASSPLASENTARFTWSFVWGDGTTSISTGTSPLTTTHVYDVGGVYTATVTVQDTAGTASPSASTSVVIGNVAPMITQFMHPNGLYGTPISFSVVVTDASTADTAAGFQILWDFGDGSPTQTGMNLEAVTHTYAAPGTYTVTVTATDENSLQATATGTTVVGDTTPVIGLGGNQTIPHNTPVTLTPTITPENPAWTYTYAWKLGDGTTATTPTVTKSYPTFGMYTVSLTVTDPYGASGSTSIVLTVVDTPPTVTNVMITPSAPDPLQALTLSYTYASSVNDPESGTTIVWYLNGQLAPTYNGLLTVPGSAVQRNQQWYAVVTPSDGFLTGPPVQSNTVSIGDPPPTALNVVVSPAAPKRADSLVLMYTYSDAFGYAEAGTTIAWTRNGVVQPNLASQRSVPTPLTRGDVWQATVTPSDGFSIGTSVSSAAVTVQDTAPVLGSLSNIAETARLLLTPASWTVAGSDADNDPLTFDCFVGTKDFGPGPTYTESFPVGTTVVTCSVSDGTLTTTGTFQVAIGDVPPVVTVTPSQTINPGVLSLTAVGQDPLGRTLTYQWTQLSGPASLTLTGGTTPSITLTPITAGAYVLACTVSNGAEQASAQTTVTVAQLAPLVNLGAGPRTMVAGETITLDGSHSVDPNGGTLSYKWTITSGMVQLSSATSPMVTVNASIGGRATVTLTVSNGALSATGSLAINIWGSADSSPVGPIAVVGADQTVLAGSTVVLDGTGSFDPNAQLFRSTWSQQSGPATVTLQQATSPQSQFVAQSTGTYVFQLTASDGAGSSSTTSTVTVLPQLGDQLPIAVVASSDLSLQVGGTAALDGTGSSALGGHPLTYQWSRVSGPYVVLTDATQSVCQVTPYGEGEIVVQLVVNDGTFSSLPTQVTVHATEGVMTSPTAIAQVTPPAYAGVPVTLDGSASSDPNGLPLLYQWQQLTGAPAAIYGSETAQASFTPSDSGAASFQLTVSDWIFGTSAQVLVSVQPDVVPVAIATGPTLSYVGDTVTLDGRQSHDSEGRPLTFAWTQMIGPIVTLVDASTANPTFAPAGDGTYVFQLVVSNGLFTSAPVTVTTKVQHYPTLHGGGCESVPGADWVGVLCLMLVFRLRRPSVHLRRIRARSGSL